MRKNKRQIENCARRLCTRIMYIKFNLTVGHPNGKMVFAIFFYSNSSFWQKKLLRIFGCPHLTKDITGDRGPKIIDSDTPLNHYKQRERESTKKDNKINQTNT